MLSANFAAPGSDEFIKLNFMGKFFCFVYEKQANKKMFYAKKKCKFHFEKLMLIFVIPLVKFCFFIATIQSLNERCRIKFPTHKARFAWPENGKRS